MEKIDEFRNEGFDKYGFKKLYCLQSDDVFYIIFYTKNANNNILIQDGKAFPDNFVTFSCPAELAKKGELDNLDIVETIKYLLEHNSSNCKKILLAMPSCLYEHKEVRLDILSCVPSLRNTERDAAKAIEDKYNIIHEYYEDSKKQSPEQIHKKIEEPSKNGSKALYDDGGKK